MSSLLIGTSTEKDVKRVTMQIAAIRQLACRTPSPVDIDLTEDDSHIDDWPDTDVQYLDADGWSSPDSGLCPPPPSPSSYGPTGEDHKHDGPMCRGAQEWLADDGDEGVEVEEDPTGPWLQSDSAACELEALKKFHTWKWISPELRAEFLRKPVTGRKYGYWEAKEHATEKTDPKGKLWMGIFFSGNPDVDKPTETQRDHLEQFFAEHTVKYAYQLERGEESGRLHWQLCFTLKKPLRWVNLYRLLLTYGLWSMRIVRNDTKKYGAAAMYKYCQKVDTRIEGPWHKGMDLANEGRRTDLINFTEAIKGGATDKQLVEDHTACWYRHGKMIHMTRDAFCPLDTPPKTVEFRYGGSGAGKTTSVITDHPPGTVFKLSKPNGSNTLWWNGYNPTVHSVVLIDEFWPPWIPLTTLMGLMDDIPQEVQIKGGSVKFRPKKLIITANRRLLELFKTEFEITPEHIMAFHRRVHVIRHYRRVPGWKKGDPQNWVAHPDEQFKESMYDENGLPV